MNHEAIYKCYPNVRTINDNLGAFDDNGNKVQIDENLVAQAAIQIDLEKNWKLIRKKRNNLLSESDWTQTLDAQVDKQAWAQYRQQLRDLPQEYPDPKDIVWPTPPTQ